MFVSEGQNCFYVCRSSFIRRFDGPDSIILTSATIYCRNLRGPLESLIRNCERSYAQGVSSDLTSLFITRCKKTSGFTLPI